MPVTKFDELFRSAQRTAFHMELRDAYGLDADYRDWQAGVRFDPADRWRLWPELVAATVARGVQVCRARVVSEPISDYVRYQYDVTTALNVKAGEQVRWLPRREAAALALPGTDFWLFDCGTVLFNHFAGNGDMTDEEVVADSAVVELCSAAFSAVWQRATPHEHYQPA